MIILSPNRVWLDYGDPIPVFCDCGKIYTPEEGTDFSQCPACDKINDHTKTKGDIVHVEQMPFSPND
jgi:hypothetical protein